MQVKCLSAEYLLNSEQIQGEYGVIFLIKIGTIWLYDVRCWCRILKRKALKVVAEFY